MYRREPRNFSTCGFSLEMRAISGRNSGYSLQWLQSTNWKLSCLASWQEDSLPAVVSCHDMFGVLGKYKKHAIDLRWLNHVLNFDFSCVHVQFGLVSRLVDTARIGCLKYAETRGCNTTDISSMCFLISCVSPVFVCVCVRVTHLPMFALFLCFPFVRQVWVWFNSFLDLVGCVSFLAFACACVFVSIWLFGGNQLSAHSRSFSGSSLLPFIICCFSFVFSCFRVFLFAGLLSFFTVSAWTRVGTSPSRNTIAN